MAIRVKWLLWIQFCWKQQLNGKGSGMNSFRLVCSCGCGDGFEVSQVSGGLQFVWFRSDWASQQHSFRSALGDKFRYLSGDRLLREVLLDRAQMIQFRDFLQQAVFEEDCSETAASAAIVPMHLLGDIYAVWLEGRMSEKDVLRGHFHEMFRVFLSETDRDVLVVQIDKWLAREDRHEIMDGASPHVTRLLKQYDAEQKKALTAEEPPEPEEADEVPAESEDAAPVEEPAEKVPEELPAVQVDSVDRVDVEVDLHAAEDEDMEDLAAGADEVEIDDEKDGDEGETEKALRK